ncbi:tetratricopeptide (TPR) repeat protein [Streptomyces sp. V3I8]|uniref:CHAT domain-containing tetratricopeptide repeat protein n=1 Tax=Streptomyces sp. V3I8 TaxID=3042279 RepID=UPI0027858F35|nr:CHAT domain-containing protein [Streptomyces sp. V3I8]MDQ1041578.1 tetratricopeptide (TPR) repeat protein [Streptomyces sp. V3I8]
MTGNEGAQTGPELRRRARELAATAIRERQVEPLTEAAALLMQAAAADPEQRGRYVSDLGVVLTHHFELTGVLGALQGALDAHRAAVRESPDSTVALSNLGLCLTHWFEQTGEVERLGEAVDVLRLAAGKIDEDNSHYPAHQSNLGLALTRWSERTEDADAALEAVAAHTAAIKAGRSTPADAAARLANLGMALMVLYRATGDRPQLTAAVEAYRNAVRTVPPGDANAPGCYAGLGDALSATADADGDITLCLDAIEELRTVVEGLQDHDPDAPLFLNQFATALRAIFTRTGDTRALDEAIQCRRAALTRTPIGHPHRLFLASNLATTLRARFEYTKDLAVLREAVTLLEGVLEDADDDLPERVKWEADLGNCLSRLGEHERDVDLLDRAAAALRNAAGSVCAPHPDMALHEANLGAALIGRIEIEWDPHLQEEAVEVLNRSLERPGGEDSLHANVHFSLGLAHRARFIREGASDAYRDAVGAFTAAQGPAAPGRTRADAAQHLGRLHMLARDFDAGLAALSTALELLDLVAWQGLERDDQERHLVPFTGLGSAAAACALEISDPERALAVLEQGRGVLLGQTLAVRTDHDELRAREPALAAELAALHAEIESATQQRQRRAVRRDNLLDRIRSCPCFERFLLAPDPAALRPPAGSGPVVTLNVSLLRCDALVTTERGTEAVPLPGLTAGDAAERAGAFVSAVNANAWGTNDTVREVLAWLWEAVTEPVFTHLGLPASDSRTLPHLWWVPTGPLSVLPVHAAGLHTAPDGDRHSALHRVASSYAPTLSFLRHVRDRPAGPDQESALVVAMGGDTAPLAMAEVEADLVAADLAADYPGRVVHLVGGQATRQAVLEGLSSSGWAHFACHCVSDTERPSDSCLRLSDGDLRVRDIAALQLAAGGVVYLSACTTALSGGRLPDETIHISSAFQLAGFSTAIGTLWRVPDLASQETARITYTALAHHPPARAVNLAAREMRQNYLRNPYEWAAFVHSGPV